MKLANSPACELLGYRLDEVIGLFISDVDLGFSAQSIKALDNDLVDFGKHEIKELF